MFSFKPSYPHPTVDHNRAQGEILKAILVLPFPHFSPLPPDLIFLFFSFFPYRGSNSGPCARKAGAAPLSETPALTCSQFKQTTAFPTPIPDLLFCMTYSMIELN